MAIPPFPAQDLAKLVLGYLVEEQLMTAYDEFLHTSPYLDAQKNEYDRIFMHSLRKILAEYRAVRIHVESCKPIALRKKLLQCNNLLEIVTFLVRNIDITKLQKDVSSERISLESQYVSTSKIGCDDCHSLRLGNCVCNHTKRNVSSSKSCNNTESIDTVESLAQATSLSDLPGNKDPDNKHVEVLEPQLRHSTSIGGPIHEALTLTGPSINKASIEKSSIIGNHHVQSHPYNSMSSSVAQKSALVNTTSMECSQNIAEFNTVLKQVYNKSNVTGSMRDNSNMVCEERNNASGMSTAGTFQDFSSGIGGVAKSNINVPDSSTSENLHVQVPHYENNSTQLNQRNVLTGQTKKCMFRVGNVKHDVTEISSEIIDVETVDAPQTSKPEEQKITIISDVKVKKDSRLIGLPPTSKMATSTPLLQTQTIFINGTPVYNPKPREQNYTFTRDEIMAMPTIILVPASGPMKSVPSDSTQPQAINAQSSSTTTSTSTLAPSLPPLSVDVSNSSSNANNILPNVHNVPAPGNQIAVSKLGLVKTVEAMKNASVPKDSIIPCSTSTNTPQMLPPKRRSSSTPRRTSHVRVLDFTTPRRILNETITEDPNQEGAGGSSTEVFISKSPNVSLPQDSIVDNTKKSDTIIADTVTDKSIAQLSEENNRDQKKSVLRKEKGWDADLRALAIASASVDNRIPAPKPKVKTKSTKKAVEQKGLEKKPNDSTSVGKTKKKTNVKSNTTPNVRSSKKKEKQADKKGIIVSIPCPNLLFSDGNSDKENPLTCIKEPEKIQNKSNDEDRIETPEVERLSLHHEIGVKLNISDLLETPYKQALYDIQIETPRFLGHDLPDDPMSDIKIMDIPTPRFLSNSNMAYTPKPAQITPSSYSSRPTDYSSGGSYYKPDDQDYMPIMDDLGCPVTSTLSKGITKSGSVEISQLKECEPIEKPKKSKSSRPIRQCTKNVSYYNSPAINKTNDTDKKDDASSCSDTISANSSFDNAIKEITATLRSDKTKRPIKGGNNKSPRSIKKSSPLKKASLKPFMKIKPRRPTPIKDAARKTNRKLPETTQNSIKRNSRNRSNSKDKGSSVTSPAVPAPTKSRRKSSTPRKLHSTKTNSESSGHESPVVEAPQTTQIEIQNSSVSCIHDSDTEQLRLRWSDDGSQDTKVSASEVDEISQIKEYINKTIPAVPSNNENDGSLQNDLIKRGFDLETAKIIERDLLHTPANENDSEKVIFLEPHTEESKINKVLERSVESDSSTLVSNLVINEESDSEYVELSVHECNEESANYIVVQHDDTESPPKNDLPKLKDKFSMEVFIDDGVVVRLRATAFDYFSDQNNEDLELQTEPEPEQLSPETNRETEIAVSSISNIDRLYSPFKDTVRAQCLDIFNSTLTSIDTPLKTNSQKPNEDSNHDCTVTEIVSGEIVDKVEIKEKTEKRKRKRSHCSSASEESVNDHKVVKKVKPETQYILNSKEIKNLDIETVLSRLHGP